MYSTVFRCLLVVLRVFLALLHNHCYSPHKANSRLAISIWQGPGPVATKMLSFRRNSSLLQIFSAPTQEGNLLFLSKRSARKKLYNFPIKLNHLCRTSRHIWLSSSVCDRCCAYQLICITTISTYTAGARAHFFTVLEPNKCVILWREGTVKSFTRRKRKEWQNNERQVWNKEAARLSGPLERSVSLGGAWFHQRCNVLQGMWSALSEFDFSQSNN